MVRRRPVLELVVKMKTLDSISIHSCSIDPTRISAEMQARKGNKTELRIPLKTSMANWLKRELTRHKDICE